MRGHRKLFVISEVLAALLAGLAITSSEGIYVAFAAACVGAGGWFFRANVDEHKTKVQP